MTDSQLLDFLQHHTGNVCGRFHTDQLNNAIPLPVKKISWLKYFFSITLPALMLSYRADAQRLLKRHESKVELTEKPFSKAPHSNTTIVQGCVKDEQGNPVSYASVMVTGTNTGVATDSDGNFKLAV